MRRIIIIFFVALAVALPACAQDFHWQKTVAPGKTIEIKNLNGQIIAGHTTGGSVEVSAIKHARWGDPSSIRIEVVESDAGATVCAIYPNTGSSLFDGLLRYLFSVKLAQTTSNEVCAPGDSGWTSLHSNNGLSVDFAVQVPNGVRFVGRNVNGKVEAVSLEGEAEAYTVNGSVRVGSSDYAQASSVNGAIQASIGNLNKPASFRTVNGAITVELPANVKASLDASTVNGGISSDFPLTVQGSFSGRRMNGTIGGGGPHLALTTVNGGIHLLRRQ
jgi:hypothetical protein